MKTEKTQRLRRRSRGSAPWERAAGVCDGWSAQSRTEEIGDSSVETFHFPRRRGEILRNFDFILPNFDFILPNFDFILRNFHFILPKFHFGPP